MALLRDDLRRWGLLRSLYRRIMRRLAPVLNVSFAVSRPLGVREVRLTCAGCSIRIATREDLARAAANPALQMTPAFVDHALSRGDICAAAFDGEDMVAYTWRAFVATRHKDDVWLSFRPPYRYGYKALTLPAWRGRHLQEAISPFADQLCIERGHTMAIGFIETHNYASLTSCGRTGDEKIGVIGYLRVAGRVFPFRSPGARRAGFGFVWKPDARP
ncbi:MAG: hypothetical protein U1F14_06745 [Steroidobacteraceae bacterium]|jgi:hypothetical protein